MVKHISLYVGNTARFHEPQFDGVFRAGELTAKETKCTKGKPALNLYFVHFVSFVVDSLCGIWRDINESKVGFRKT